jgi:hypothetical protein
MDAQSPVQVNLKVKIVSITLKSFKAEKSENKDTNPNPLTYEFKVTFQPNPSAKTLLINIITKVFTEETKQTQVGEIEAEGLFSLENMEDILTQFSGNMPIGVYATFLGVLLSTVRGIILVKSEGTIIEGNLIPIINPMDIIRNGINPITLPTQLGLNPTK